MTLLLAASLATALATGRSYGFTDAEMERVLRGDVLAKPLSEGSDRELAGVVAVWWPRPLTEFAEIALDGGWLRGDPSIRSFHVWKRGEPADAAFTDLHVDAEQRAMLERRYEAYSTRGLKGTPAPARELLAIAIQETKALDGWPSYAKALLEFPAESQAGMEHRFFAYRQDVEGRPTFILSHRAGVHDERSALITEQRYYVSQSYICRFIASQCFEASGGTLMFYVNRLFTDQVSGVGSSLKHALGRRKMLAGLAANMRRDREKLGGSPKF
jgi:hypothetical protein